jgi:hypothetical protein
MTIAFINPGTEPIQNASFDLAVRNMDIFLNDCGFTKLPINCAQSLDRDGRYGFIITTPNGKACEVLMPGLETDRVRYKVGDNPFLYPRLYVDGSSWLWSYAVNAVKRALAGEG